MKITLTNPRNITIKPASPAEIVTITELEIISISDDCESSVKALISIEGIQSVLVLWEDAAYVSIGDWTQQDANERIDELLN